MRNFILYFLLVSSSVALDKQTNKTIKDGDIAPDSSGTICLHGQMERFEQIEKKRTMK